jgi:3-methyladenine DNA glycosylase Tag
MAKARSKWGTTSQLYIDYHDNEWVEQLCPSMIKNIAKRVSGLCINILHLVL